MILGIIPLVMGSILLFVGLGGIFQMESLVDCNKVTNENSKQWCNQISIKQYDTLYGLLYTGFVLDIIGTVVILYHKLNPNYIPQRGLI